MTTRKVAMMGSGWIAPIHIRAFQANNVEVVALMSTDLASARAVCAETGISPRLTDSIGTLVTTECDFFDVLVPPLVQYGYASALAGTGRPVLCEKPMALSMAEAQHLIDARRSYGALVMIVHNQLFFGPHVRARQLIDAGAIGEPKLLRLHLVGNHSATSDWKRMLDERGGLIWDDCIHRLYTARYLMGEVAAVRGSRFKLVNEPDAGRSGTVTLEFAQQRMGTLDFSYRLGGEGFYDDSLAIMGTEGAIQINGAYGQPWPMPRMSVRTKGAWREEPVESSWAQSFVALVAHFLECIDEGIESELIGCEAALETIRIAAAIEQSFASGREVRLTAPSPA